MINVPGAVELGSIDPRHPDAALVAHYGDPSREQRVLETAVGLVDRGNRGVLTVSGKQRLPWLHSLTSQYLEGLAPMTGTETLLLSPHGHVEQHAMVIEDGERCWLDVEPGSAGELTGFLTRMVFMTEVEPVDVSAGFRALSLVGPQTAEVLAGLGVEWGAPDGGAGPAGVAPAGQEPVTQVVADPVPRPKFVTAQVPKRATVRYPVGRLSRFDALVRDLGWGADLLVPADAVQRVVEACAAPLAGIWAYEALRVAARRPRLGFETDHRTLPAEVGWQASAVHLAKGCYRGQETIARVHHLGRPPRQLVLLHFDGISTDRLPERHEPVTTADGKPVGMVGTAVRHHELGMVATALLTRSAVGRSRSEGSDDDRADAGRQDGPAQVLLVGPATVAIDPD